MFAIYLVFSWGLGAPDVGLFVGTYVGYWFMGLAMLSIGMVASFLTSNLTVGFILGMIFNLPLAMFGVADWIIKNPDLAQAHQALERGRAVRRLPARRDQPGRHQLLRDDRRRDALPQHGADRPAPLGRPRRRRHRCGPTTWPARSALLAAGGRRQPVPVAITTRCAPTSPARSSTRSPTAPSSWSTSSRDNPDVKTIQYRRLRQPAGAGRVRGPQAQPALHALGAQRAERRQDSSSTSTRSKTSAKRPRSPSRTYGIEPRDVSTINQRRPQHAKKSSSAWPSARASTKS